MNNYLISLNSATNKFVILEVNNVSFDVFSSVILAENIAPEIIHAAMHRLLESLKEKQIDGRNYATGTENT